jgi:NAD(P)H dehydrogenase (quinone)
MGTDVAGRWALGARSSKLEARSSKLEARSSKLGPFLQCGFAVLLAPFVAYMPGRVGDAGRAQYLEDYRWRLLDLDTAPRLFFHPAEDYGPNERLEPGVIARSGVQRNV